MKIKKHAKLICGVRNQVSSYRCLPLHPHFPHLANSEYWACPDHRNHHYHHHLQGVIGALFFRIYGPGELQSGLSTWHIGWGLNKASDIGRHPSSREVVSKGMSTIREKPSPCTTRKDSVHMLALVVF